MRESIAREFLKSALSKGKNAFQSLDSFWEWFDKKNESGHFVVEEIPFEKLDKWHIDSESHNISHESGKFFSIEGIRISSNFLEDKSWNQPIINQPEVGILGIIVMKFNGVLHFLMQAKMEPGNVNILQISPTVQATKSNYTQVHKGNLPAYLEYFLDEKGKHEVLFEQVQPEQSAKFFRKKNNNLIIKVEEDIELKEDFIWLTLADIIEISKQDNIMNMDSRSVLSCIQFFKDKKGNRLTQDLLQSINCEDALFSMEDHNLWLNQLKAKYDFNVDRINLNELEDWEMNENKVFHKTKTFFDVIAVRVEAGNREVVSWTQPLLKDQNEGLIGFLVKRINGIYHFLVQGKFEPGNQDKIDLSPTISFANWESRISKGDKVPFIEYFHKGKGTVILNIVQSEEGGRFYHLQNRNMIIDIDAEEIGKVPENFQWMTLGQIYEFIEKGLMNVEARSVISCLPIE